MIPASLCVRVIRYSNLKPKIILIPKGKLNIENIPVSYMVKWWVMG
jgi:hypothetical protein